MRIKNCEMEVTKTTNKRRRGTARVKKILSPNSRRVLQDLADQDWQLIESITKHTISKLNDVGTVTPPHPILQFLVGGGEEKVAEKINEASDTARTDALPHAADSNSQDKSEQNAQKVTPGLPRVRERARRRTSRFLVLDHGVVETNDEKFDETSATTLTGALLHAADSNSQDKSEQNAQKVTRGLPRVRKRAHRRTRRFLQTLDEKLDKTLATAVTVALPHAADSNSQDKSEQNAQKVTPGSPRERIRRRARTRLPTLGSQINRESLFSHGHIKKNEDKPMESFVHEVSIYLASVLIRYHMD